MPEYQEKLEELVNQFNQIEQQIQTLLVAREQARGKITMLKELIEIENKKVEHKQKSNAKR